MRTSATYSKANPPHTKKGQTIKRYTLDETRKQENFILSGLIAGISTTVIKRQFLKEFPEATRSRWAILLPRVVAELKKEDKDRASLRRSEAIARITDRMNRLDRRAKEADNQNDMRLARSLFAEARAQEMLLADFTGARQPIKIEVDTRVRETVTVLMAQMPIEVINANLAQYRENMRLADLAKLLPEHKTVEVNGVSGRHHT